MHAREIWNSCTLRSPQPIAISTSLNPLLKRKLTTLRVDLYKVLEIINLQCLHIEAATLSRFLYRNYRILNKDKGFQLLRMIMTSLNKYLRMKVGDDIELIRAVVPSRFSPLDTTFCLPTRGAMGWLLSRIQAMIALFYRIFQISKKAGRQLYGRLRLRWNSPILLFALGLTARIHVLARFIVQQMVASYENILPLVRLFNNENRNDLYLEYPRDIKSFFGGMDDALKAAMNVTNTVDMTLQLIDLTDDGEEDQSDFLEILKHVRGGDQDEEVQRICEIVNLDATNRKADADAMEILVSTEEEDIGEPVVVFDKQKDAEVNDNDYGSPVKGKRRPSTKNSKKSPNKKIKLMETINLSTSETEQSSFKRVRKNRHKNRKLKNKKKISREA